MSSGDTGFIMLCSALVFLMTPGLAFFYGGLVRRKNVVNTMMACIGIMGLSIVMWVLFGYSLSFGGNHAGIIGDFRYFAFQGVGADPGPYADTIPHLVFAGFQMMFAVITPALITGAVVGRMRFKENFNVFGVVGDTSQIDPKRIEANPHPYFKLFFDYGFGHNHMWVKASGSLERLILVEF